MDKPSCFVTNVKQLVIFTDVDGTLIDHDTYQFEEAKSTLDVLRGKSIPVILCTSKTRFEIEGLRNQMGLYTPFVVENGAAVFVPRDTCHGRPAGFIEKGDYFVFEMGTPYGTLCQVWNETKAEEPFRMKGFSEMTVQEIALHTGLPLDQARLAAMREYSEPFLFFDTPDRLSRLKSLLAERGLQITRGGRFFHLIGNNDKGKAIAVLKGIYEDTFHGSALKTVGLGDSANDIPMLRNVDVAIVIKKKAGGWEKVEGLTSVVYSEKPGPAGWSEEICRLLA
jgi:mannosyl-3-phosphoglycerate phosphatase